MIYLFDKDEKLIKVVRKPAIKTALQKYALTTERYVSDRLTVEMKGLNDDELEEVEYMAIQSMEDTHTFHYFYVAQKSSEQLTTLIGVQSGIEELRKIPVYDKRPKDAFAQEVIDYLLEGTNWQARFFGEKLPRSTNFYYISVFDALKKVCEVWDLEMQFFVEMNGNRIGARYIDFKPKIGQAVGKRVVYGHNALEILQEVERTNIFTALIGRGKGEQVSSAEENDNQADGYGRKITFEDVVWSTAKGNPLNKPKGQKYLELPNMTKLYGIKQIDGSMRPKIGFVEFSEEEDPEVLLERTYKALIDTSRPQLTLKTSTVYLKGVKIGDTIRVVRHDKKMDYDTRIFEITFNRLNNQSSDIKFGDRIGESNEAKAQTIADKAIDEFIANEFSTFVQKLPDFLPDATGFNNNWYSTEDPTKKHPGKVLINDIWYKPDPEHSGHKIMYRWTGEVWEEILRTYDSEALRSRIADEVTKLNDVIEANERSRQKEIDSLLQKAGVNKSLAEEAKRTGDQAKLDAAKAMAKALEAKNEAIAEAKRLDTVARQGLESNLTTIKSQAVSETTQLVNNTKKILESQITATNKSVEDAKKALENQISGVSTEVVKTKDSLKSLATKKDIDATNQRVTNTESLIIQQSDQIAQKANQTAVDTLSGRVSSAESSITQKADQILVEAHSSAIYNLGQGLRNAATRLQVLNDQIALKASKSAVDSVTSRLSNAEANLAVQADEIASRVKKNELDAVKQQVTNAESSMTQLSNRITTEISETVSKIPTELGVRNLIKGTKDLSGNINKNHNTSDTYLGFNVAKSKPSSGYADTFRATMTTEAVADYYVVTFYARSEVPDSTITSYFFSPATTRSAETNTGSKSGAPDGAVVIRLTNKWKRYWIKWTQSPTDGPKSIIIGRNSTTNNAVSVAGVALYEGQIPQDWSPAPEDAITEIESVKTVITQTAEGQRQLSTKLTETTNKVTSAETNIKQLINDVSSKVSQTEFDNAKKTIENNSTLIKQSQDAINLKAEKTYVDNVKDLADSARTKATDALDVANTNAESIKTTKAELQVTSDAVKTKVSQTEFNKSTKRLATAETMISQQAGLIEQRLTSSQVESAINAKGYQTKADVDKNITGRGYITENALQPYVTSTVLENKVKEASDSFSRSITETKALIPSDFSGGNLVRNSAFPVVHWPGSKVATHPFYYNEQKTLFLAETSGAGEVITSSNRFDLKRNTEYSLSFYAFASNNVKSSDVFVLGRKAGETADFTTVNKIISDRKFSTTKAEYVTVTFNSGEVDNAYLRFDNNGSTNGKNAVMFFAEVMLVEGKTPRKWEAAFDDLITETRFNEVKDTVNSHTRTLGEQGQSISQVIQTAEGLVTRVNNLKIGSRNYLLNSKKLTADLSRGSRAGVFDLAINISADFWKNDDVRKSQQIKLSLYYKPSVAYEDGTLLTVYFRKTPWHQLGTIRYPADTTEVLKFEFTFGTMPLDFSADQIFVRFSKEKDGGRIHTIERALLEIGDFYSDWTPAPEDESEGVQAVTSQVSQLAGSWAVQNLTNSGSILNQLNLNRDGSVKIDGRLVQITGTTYIQDGVITSAKLGDVDAGKIKAGTLDAANVNIINLNANKIVGLDGNFIRSKIEFAMIEWMRGKTITAKNGNMRINLNDANITFNADATINFNSPNNALVRKKGAHTAFVHFNDVSAKSDGGVGSLYASIGVTSSGDGINSQSSGRFAGIRAFRGAKGLEHGATVDQVEIYGDSIMFRDDFTADRGLDINPVSFDRNYKMHELIDCIKFLARVYIHLSNVHGDWKNMDFLRTFVNEFNSYRIASILDIPLPNGNTFHF